MSEAMDRLRAEFRESLSPQDLQIATTVAGQCGVPVERYLDDLFDARLEEWTELVEEIGPSEAARYWSDEDDSEDDATS